MDYPIFYSFLWRKSHSSSYFETFSVFNVMTEKWSGSKTKFYLDGSSVDELNTDLLQFVNIYGSWIFGFQIFIVEYYRNHQHLQCMLNHHVHPKRRHKLKIRISKNFKYSKSFFVCFFDYVFRKQLRSIGSDGDALVRTSHSTGCE